MPSVARATDMPSRAGRNLSVIEGRRRQCLPNAADWVRFRLRNFVSVTIVRCLDRMSHSLSALRRWSRCLPGALLYDLPLRIAGILAVPVVVQSARVFAVRRVRQHQYVQSDPSTVSRSFYSPFWIAADRVGRLAIIANVRAGELIAFLMKIEFERAGQSRRSHQTTGAGRSHPQAREVTFDRIARGRRFGGTRSDGQFRFLRRAADREEHDPA